MSSDQPNGSDALEHGARRHATLLLWLANVVAGTVIGTSYLRHVPDDVSTRAAVFVCLGLVSSVVTLALIPAAMYWLVLRFVRTRATAAVILSLVGSTFLSLLTIDTFVYGLLGYHVNGAVWNVMLTRGSGDAVVLGWRVWIPVVLGSSLIALAEFGLWYLLHRRRAARKSVARKRGFALRPVAWCFIVFLGIASIEKSIYAAAELSGDHQVRNVSQVLPMYQGLRVSQLLPEHLEGDFAEVSPVEFDPKGEPLVYPLAQPAIDPQGRRPNILLLVLDSWRQDLFCEEATPELWRFAQDARRFDDHLSGGNGTRFGVFSMLYGLHGSYWFSVLEERHPPVLVETLGRLGYDRAVFSSASQSFPEFRETAWIGMEEGVHDDFPAELSYERDELLARAFRRWLGERSARGADEPFFAFVLLDSPHQPYYSPPDGPFQPAAEELDYMELARSNSPELVERVFNRYRNSLHHGDRVAGEILRALDELDRTEDTLVVVTGDHGEEFQETGYWGHTSNFTAWQLAVPLFMKGPGIEPGLETRPTSHLDLAATLLELLGADPAQRASWTLGENLLDPKPRGGRVVAGWEHLGLVTDEGTFRIPMGCDSSFDVEFFDARWRFAPDQVEAYREHTEELERLAAECRAFLR